VVSWATEQLDTFTPLSIPRLTSLIAISWKEGGQEYSSKDTNVRNIGALSRPE
jgi:hypothetical protein